MSPIPQFSYDLLYEELVIRSIAAEIPVHAETQLFPLAQANVALNALKHDAIRGAAVLQVAGAMR